MDGVDRWMGENGRESQDAGRVNTEREMRVEEKERMREREREETLRRRVSLFRFWPPLCLRWESVCREDSEGVLGKVSES